jgi:hypothetical protein
MRRILGRGDQGDDVALVQDTLNDVMPFARPAARVVNVGTVWEQEAAQRDAIAGSKGCKLNGPFEIPSWGTVRDWDDLSYDWGYGALAAARKLDGRMPPPRLTGDLVPHNYKPIQVDGDFGSATEGVVKQFQRLSGLPADGIVGPATWDALIATSVFSILVPMQQPGQKRWVWRKPDDKLGSFGFGMCYDDKPVRPGEAPPPGYHMEQVEDESGVKVEVQKGIQSGDASRFVLGQIIFVRPKGKGDYLGFLPGHTEFAIGAQLNVGDSVQIFVSVTRADLFKLEREDLKKYLGQVGDKVGQYVDFSVDAQLQEYVQLRTSPRGHGGAGAQIGPTANLNLTPMLKKLLGDDTTLDAAIFGSVAVQGQFGLDPDGTGSWGVTLPWNVGVKISKSFK